MLKLLKNNIVLPVYYLLITNHKNTLILQKRINKKKMSKNQSLRFYEKYGTYGFILWNSYT